MGWFFTPCRIIATILLWITISSCHRDAKENIERIHEEVIDLGHEEPRRIHLRHSGLEGFAKDENKEPKNVLHMEEFVRSKEHIKEHAKGDLDFDPDNATAEELDFHFFKLHDSDGDSHLDGLELLEAIMHGLEEQFEDIEEDEDFSDTEKQEEKELINIRAYRTVDKILDEDDNDKDGYISYGEFVRSRRATNVIRDAHEDEY